MKQLDASAVRMVSGGTTMISDWDHMGGGDGGDFGGDYGGGGGGPSIYDGTSGGGAWESGWGEWNRSNAPSESHLAFDTALAGAAGARTGMAVTAFTEGFLIGAGAGSWAGPAAALAGLAVGGYVLYKAKGVLGH
jgi:hypothetical protein